MQLKELIILKWILTVFLQVLQEEKAAETEPEEVQIQQSIPAEVEIIEAEKGTPAEDDMKIRTEEEINEFFKSLGIELGEKEDE